MKKALALCLIFVIFISVDLPSYPYDGYERTGIARLKRLELILDGELKGKSGPVGQHLKLKDIKLNLPYDTLLCQLPEEDIQLKKALESVIPNRQKRYSLTVMDITPGRPIRYAAQKENLEMLCGCCGAAIDASSDAAAGTALNPETIFRRAFHRVCQGPCSLTNNYSRAARPV